MNNDIGKIVSECLNNPLIQHYFIKRRNMSYGEKESQEKNFARMIGYCILFRETDGIEEYMALTSDKQQIQFLKFRIADKLGIPHNEINSRIEEIISYAFDNFIRNGYVYHAANSKSAEYKMKNGLGFLKRPEEHKKELMTISEIFKKYDDDRPLGWGTLDIVYGKEGWFFDGTPNNMLYYADSPEWFGQLCGNSMCYAWGFIPEEKRHGYANRDYETCLFAITKLLDKNNMSEEDRLTVLEFFNKCWVEFGNTEPCLLFVPISSLRDELYMEKLKGAYFPSMGINSYLTKEDNIFKDIIKGGCMFMGNNTCTKMTVNPEDLICVNLSPILPKFKVSESIEHGDRFSLNGTGRGM